MVDQPATQPTDDTRMSSGAKVMPAKHFDVTVVDYPDLISRCMGNMEFAEKLLAKFEQQLNADLLLLEREINKADVKEVARIAHRLKGACASVSANGLQDVFARLEQVDPTARSADLLKLLDELNSEWSRFKALD